MSDNQITIELLKKWRAALHTQYQIRGDAIVPRNSMDAPTIEQMSIIRSAHYGIIPLIDYCLAFTRPIQDMLDEKAFERIFVKHFPTKSVHRFACKEIWQSSQSAFAAELMRGLEDEMYDDDHAEDGNINHGIEIAIALVRQMAGEK